MNPLTYLNIHWIALAALCMMIVITIIIAEASHSVYVPSRKLTFGCLGVLATIAVGYLLHFVLKWDIGMQSALAKAGVVVTLILIAILFLFFKIFQDPNK